MRKNKLFIIIVIIILYLCPANLMAELDLVITNIIFDNNEVSDGIIIYQDSSKKKYIPLSALFKALKIPVTVDMESKSVHGWFGTENKEVYLDAEKLVFHCNSNESKIDKKDVFIKENDIYLEQEALSRWVPLKLIFDRLQLTLTVYTDAQLPITINKEKRERRAALAKSSAGESCEPDVPVKNDKTRFSAPFIDINSNYNSSTGSKKSNGVFSYTLSGHNQFYGYDTAWSYYDKGDGNSRRLINLSFKKTETDEFPIKEIKQLEFGDVVLNQNDLIHKATRGRGVKISTLSNLNINNKADIFIEGTIIPGWDVELYHYGSLINYVANSQVDRYKFTVNNVNLGKNIFLLKFYGPQGQVREETKVVIVGQSKVKEGEFAIESSIFENNIRLISTGENPDIDSKAYFGTNIYYGVNKNITAMTGFSLVKGKSSKENEAYSILDLSNTWSNVLFKYRVVQQLNNYNTAHSIAAKTRLLNSDWAVDYKMFGSIQNQNSYIFNQYASSYLNLGYSTLFEHSIIGKLPIRFFYQRSVPQDNSKNVFNQYTWVLSKKIGQFFFNVSGDYIRGYNSEPSSLLTVQANMPFNRFNFRSIASYDVENNFNLNKTHLVLSYRTIEHFYEAGWQRNYFNNINDSSIDNYFLRFGWHSESGNFSLGYSFGAKDSQSINFNYSFSIIPVNNNLMFSPQSGNTGAILLHVFLDKNNNNVFDSGIDQPLEGVKFKNINPKKKTDSKGHLFEKGFAPGKVYSISLGSMNAIDSDLMLVSVKDTYRFTTKSGSTLIINVPVIEVSDIDGILINTKDTPIEGVDIYLYDMQDKLVMKTRSLFDGYYLFHKVPKGEYKVKFEADQLKKKGYAPILQKVVDVTNDSPVVTIKTLYDGDSSSVVYTFKELLEKKALTLSYAKELFTPVRSRVSYGRVNDRIEKSAVNKENEIRTISSNIINNVVNTSKLKNKIFMKLLYRLSRIPFIKGYLKKNFNLSPCSNCGICENACSSNNIEVKDESAY
ncbi:MAG: hypothetical protein GY730_01450 [bacterium]|nr:hypothetical protein [bacterium]